jgi:hypothetical protein
VATYNLLDNIYMALNTWVESSVIWVKLLIELIMKFCYKK